MSDLEPIDLFIEEVNNDEIDIKIDAIHKIPIVAAISGPETTRTKLLQVITEVLQSEEDELMQAIAVELYNLKDQVGGVVHYDKLLSILEKLAQEQETVVREEAVKSIVKLAKLMNTQHIRTILYPMVITLSESIQFPGKIAATCLFEIVYPHLNKDEKDAIRVKFIELFNDETTIVKRSMSKNLPSFALVLEKEHIVKEIIPIIQALSKDDSDMIRSSVLESIILIAKKFNKDENNKYFMTLLSEHFYNDKSFRVREEYPKYQNLMQENIGPELTESKLLPNINTLLNDPEAEVRTITLECMCEWIDKVSVAKIEEVVQKSMRLMSSDSNNNVKLKLAKLIGIMARTLGADFTSGKLQQIAIDLINYSDNNEVKITIVKSLQEFVSIAGWGILTTSLNNMLLLLSREKQWRVRKAVVDLAIAVGKKCSKPEDQETFESVLLKGLADSAFQVRYKTVVGIKELGPHFGLDWLQAKVMPLLETTIRAEDTSYLQRITMLYAFEATSYTLTLQDVMSQVFPHYLSALADPIPNVRIVAIRNLHKFVQNDLFKNDKVHIYKQFQDALDDLATTKEMDEDVVFQASKAKEVIS